MSEKSNISISFIIPVYNTEKYLQRCLESIITLPFISFEIIIVNDGSTDNSFAIIDQYEKRYSFIHSITQENKGLSSARNTGLSKAKGEYVLFVDSDDYLECEGILKMIKIALREKPDIVVGRVRSIKLSGQIKQWPYVSSSTKLTSELYIEKILKVGYTPMVFNYMCKRDFLIKKNIYFKAGIIHEDELWTPNILLRAQTICVSPKIHYKYCVREGSIMSNSKDFKRFLSIYVIINELFFLLNNISSISCPNARKFILKRIYILYRILEHNTDGILNLMVSQLIGKFTQMEVLLFNNSEIKTFFQQYNY